MCINLHGQFSWLSGLFTMAGPSTELPPDVNRGPEILAICGTLVGIALAMVILRIWVRAVMIKHMGWDDYIMILGMVRTTTTKLICVLLSKRQ